VFVQTAIRFAIGRRRPGRGDRERGRARAKSAGRDARAGGLRARDPNAGVTTEPPIATRATKNPRARGKKTRARPFRSAGIGVFETRGRSRQCTHRLVAHLQGLELLGGLDHLDHLERESVGVCVARGVGMEAGARETLFFFHATSHIRQRRFGNGVFGESRLGRNRPNLPAPLVAPTSVRANPPRPITLNARGPDQVLVFEMSQYVARATGMATKALDVAKTRVLPPAVEWYNATMAKNAQYVVKDPEAVDKLGKQLIFSNMAKLPAAVEAAQGEIKVVQQKWANRMELPMTEVRSRRPFAHRIRRARPASSFPRERCWQHRGTPENRDTPDSPPPLAHRRLAPPPSSPRRCTRGSASGKSSAEAGA
jgi:F-type H+-transporting ATPase subunit g